MTFDELLHRLNELSGTGLWRAIAAEAGIHYDTLARIARGTQTPNARLKESIEAAVLKHAPGSTTTTEG